MPEVTDSYCERCGARYAFTPNMPKSLSLKGARVLAKGLKNFVLTDGQSMADALTLARNEDNNQDSSRMTEAFHRTFNFCMTCRQYACERCWNAKVGACLSCAPASGGQAVAPEDHLIVRTPVARWDADWSLFPEGPAVEPLARPAPPVPFNEPIRLEEPRQALAPQSSDLPIWPAGDLPTVLPVESADTPRKGRSSYQKSVDAQAADLWPITDEIAPEMTLTPEELELVETRLSQPDAPEASPDQYQPVAPTPARTSGGAASVPAWVAKNVEPLGLPAMASPVDDLSSTEPMLDAAVLPQRILHAPIASPVLPPLAPPSAALPAPEHAPMVAGLLGRPAPGVDDRSVARSRRSSGRRGQPPGDQWPHVTEWSNRPPENHGWWAASAEIGAPLEELEVEPAWSDSAVPAATPEPHLPATSQDIAPEPAARRLKPPDADARTAAAVRLSAVAGVGSDRAVPPDFPPAPAEADVFAPAVQQPLFDLSHATQDRRHFSAPEQPTWPEADQKAPEAIRNQPRRATEWTPGRPGSSAGDIQASAGPALQHPTPLGPWPPFGASWPAQEDVNGPRPAPEGQPIPAVVAAQQTNTPILAEIWAQSAQEVLNRGSVRVCHRCALPVSTQARYCRRCGTQQA
jgi:ribosomal protein L40E